MGSDQQFSKFVSVFAIAIAIVVSLIVIAAFQ
jgi:hypothetical protein